MTTAKNQFYLISIFFALIALYLIGFLVYPSLSDIENISNSILQDKEEGVLIAAESKELDNFKKNYPIYESNLVKIDQLFVDAKNPIDFIKFLEDTALASGVDANISLSNAVPSKSVNVLPVAVFQVQAQGDLLDVLEFCNKLETGQYLVKAQSLSIRKSAKEIVVNKITLKVVDASFTIEAVTKDALASGSIIK